MKKIFIYILLIIIVLSSCKKVDLPTPSTTDPVFSVNATLDGTALNWTAGDDDFYMFSEFSKDSLDIYTLTGRIAKDDNCDTDCEESLRFSIRGNAVTPSPASFDINAALSNNTFTYATNGGTLQVVARHHYEFIGSLVSGSFGQNGVTYFWSVSNGNDSSSSSLFMFDKMDSTAFSVRLEVQTAFGCTAYFEKMITDGGGNDCDLSMNVTDSAGYYLELSMNNPIGSFYTWNGVTATNPIPLNNLNGLQMLVASGQCDGTVEVGVCTEGQQNQLVGLVIPKYTYTVNEVVDSIFFYEQFSTAIIEYQDKNGVLYTSQNGENSNTFTISNVEDYEENENGEKTKKMNISYDCKLYNANNPNDFKIIQGSGVIAVAYP